MQVNDVINNLNLILEKLFKSVEGQIFEVLDNIVIITPQILKDEPLKNIFFADKANGIIIISNALLLFYVIHYIFTQLISLYNGYKAENYFFFVVKLILVSLLVNNSYFICEQIINFFSIFTDSIMLFMEEISKKEITFINLKENIISMKDFMSSDLFSLDGLIKGIISFGSISVLVNFAIRYVTFIFLILISPFAMLSITNNLTSGIFKTWIKTVVTSLFVQILVKLIIFIPIMYKNTSHVMYKVVLVGSIYLLYKLNNFTKEIFVKISEDSRKYNIFKGG